jgi:hypothetical protein
MKTNIFNHHYLANKMYVNVIKTNHTKIILLESTIPFHNLLNMILISILYFVKTNIKNYILNIISNKLKNLFSHSNKD